MTNGFAEVAQQNAGLQAAIDEGDAERTGSFYADDALLLVFNSPIVVGRSAIAESYVPLLAPEGASLKFESTGMYGCESGEFVADVGKIVYTAATGVDPVPGKYLVTWRRQPDGVWKIEADSVSTDV